MNNMNWIWSRHYSAEDKDTPTIMLFRKVVEINAKVEMALVKISADTRYKLYVNGEFEQFGPSRGDKQVWFYDEVNITDKLNEGKNCIAVIVLRYPEDYNKGNHGMIRTETPGLMMDGEIITSDERIDISSDTGYRCYKDTRTSFIREEERFAPLIIHESVNGDPLYRAWKMPEYDDRFWAEAYVYPKGMIHPAISPGNLYPRTIPFLYRTKKRIKDVSCIRRSIYTTEDWKDFLLGKKTLVIPPNTKEIVEIDAKEEMTGFIHAAFIGGQGAKVKFLYSEAYVQDGFEGPERIPVKKNRCDSKNGHLLGYADNYYLYGLGDEKRKENYNPFWFRTFRFIQILIETADEPLSFCEFDYEETGYPLEVKTKVSTSDIKMDKIWEISERTLRRCMHETYEDCPFYEQLQYIMDTRQQILYTYAISADDRLARKCIEDMRRAQRYDGLLNCSYPNCSTNVIPGFSIYYILMVYDHMMYFGDKKLVKECMPVIEEILQYFHTHLDERGLVANTGGLLLDRFWSFIDWAKEWNDTSGVPTAIRKGPITMESLLYVYGLQHAAKLSEYLGNNDSKNEFLDESIRVQEAILKYCTGANGMISDGPKVEEYSQHCQVFAVLTQTGMEKDRKNNLLRTIKDKNFTQCTVAMRFYLFRALEEIDCYDLSKDYWKPWLTMIENNCTTCVESEAYARSECHGWGALALYELPSVTLGVRPAKPGFEEIEILPKYGYMEYASGKVITPKGEVTVSWNIRNGKETLTYSVPDGIKVITKKE
ncbi:MAG: hypothetical protein K6F30_00735 [Lachnospiraceae bacterium]|nr:hypothetical protein [Lachnospiraceae bacterium]